MNGVYESFKEKITPNDLYTKYHALPVVVTSKFGVYAFFIAEGLIMITICGLIWFYSKALKSERKRSRMVELLK